MTKSLRSFPKNERARVARTRAKASAQTGLGYWAAIDYLAKEKASKIVSDVGQSGAGGIL